MLDGLRLNTKLIGSSLGAAVMAAALAWASFSGLGAAQGQLKALFAQSQKQRLAAMVNGDFQLAVSKAKNFAILRDEANRAKVVERLQAAQDGVKALNSLADGPEEQRIFDALGQSLRAVEPRLQALLGAKAADKAADLYNAHLRGVTEQFDAAIGSYVTALDERAGQELADKIQRTKAALSVCLGLALLALALNLWVALGVSRSLESVIGSLTEGVDQVASASQQVAGSSQQLAEGASESASSLEETSASMEEMASMNRQNSGNAAQAHRLMEESRTLVQRGSESVAGALASMLQMNESAGKVSKILKTIEEIAFQTNLLALNAAVEAARAGEHGRGFAVVAEEVRTLASRSAAAARDTAALLEENARRAGTGMQVSEAAAKSLAEIVESSAKVAGLVGEIAGATQEQSRGIDEINTAVGQMDKMTQRVTANAEELSAASEEMSAQASLLRTLSGRLSRLVEGGGAESLAPRTPSPTRHAYADRALAPRRAGTPTPKPLFSRPRAALAPPIQEARSDEVLPLGKEELKNF